jgi:Short-chain alcohol dehydrogenase of unknown specificity
MTARVLDGKVAIVTGAAMGMGEATARVFAAAGAHVLVSDINENLGEATVKAIQQDGGSASFYATDVSRATDAEAMVRAAVSRYGRLDCAVNNAAVTPTRTRSSTWMSRSSTASSPLTSRAWHSVSSTRSPRCWSRVTAGRS